MRHSLWGSDLPHDKMTAVQLAQRLRLHLLHRFRVLFVVTCRERATTISLNAYVARQKGCVVMSTVFSA